MSRLQLSFTVIPVPVGRLNFSWKNCMLLRILGLLLLWAPASLAVAQATLEVSLGGSGIGSVKSYPPGISCDTECTADFSPGTSVELHLLPAAGSLAGGLICHPSSLAPITAGTTQCRATFHAAPATSRVARMDGGGRHSVALDDDGVVWTWGRNDWGELGDDTIGYRPFPRALDGLPPIRQVAAANTHTAALDTNGEVWQWGSNASGELGPGPSLVPSPELLFDAPSFRAISVGSFTNVGLTEHGTVWAWGPDSWGQMGDGEPGGSSHEPQAVAGLGKVVAIASGSSHNLALLADGTVRAWGYNAEGELGDGSWENRSRPVTVSGLSEVVSVAARDHISMAITRDGDLWAWGRNSDGQLGIGNNGPANEPVPVALQEGPVIAVALGTGHGAALLADGAVWTWGRGGNGQLGNGTYNDSLWPVPVSDMNDAVSVAAGHNHVLVRRRNGSVWGWGSDPQGALGDGVANHSHNRPVASSGFSPRGPARLAAGYRHSLAVHHDGSVWSWGRNTNGELGDGGGDRAQPQMIWTYPPARQVAAGNQHSALLDRNGALWQWGSDLFGELGMGSSGGVFPTPVQLTVPPLRSVSKGSFANAGITEDGRVFTWGPDTYGQLGDGQPGGTGHPPGQVSGLEAVMTVAAGGQHVLALLADGTLRAWGRNQFGQLGDASLVNRSQPVVVVSLADLQAVAACPNHSLALTSGGDVYAWGDNSFGQLGDGTTQGPRTTPVLVSGVEGAVRIACGSGHSVALLTDGTLQAWGRAVNGELGNGDRLDSPVPVKVSFLGAITRLSAGTAHTLVGRADGALWAWGSDAQGQLGDGQADHSHDLPRIVSALNLEF